jgi:hypothetical protein
MNQPRHVLELRCGITCELVLDEATGVFDCMWSQRPTKELLPAIMKEYGPWRNSILEEWSRHSGKKMLVLDL